LYGDNQACLTIARGPEHHGRTKAIDVRYHYIRDLIARGIVTAEYTSTEEMLADGLTKALPRGKLEAHGRAYGLFWLTAGKRECCGAPSSSAQVSVHETQDDLGSPG
jgi:hypothetical protein